MMMICSLPAHAEYTNQLVIPPGAENAQTFGINNAGTVVGELKGSLREHFSRRFRTS
jgi:hypothetical protein